MALFCSTDREDCCTDEFNIAGSWFLPNGSKLSLTMNTQALHMHITLGSQTVGLNIMNSPELHVPTGVYHYEMMDKQSVTHYLYVGIYLENEGNYYTHIRVNKCTSYIHLLLFLFVYVYDRICHYLINRV